MERTPTVYVVASGFNGTLYTGVTSNLLRRVAQHRSGELDGFTSRYGVKRLVWFEVHETMEQAITREKRVKNWRREWKIELVRQTNPFWRDLAEDLGFEPLVKGWTPDQVRGDGDGPLANSDTTLEPHFTPAPPRR